MRLAFTIRYLYVIVYCMSEASPGALDRLVRMNPTQVASFVLSADIVRASVTAAGEALLLLPERGALPIYWTADGYPDEEKPMAGDGVVQLPIGTFDFMSSDARELKGTLNTQQKEAVVARHRTLLTDASRILIIDEVQKGGTITELVNIVDRQRGEQPNRMYVVAAQDSRKKVSSESKTPAYQSLVVGTRKGATATVVPMPLIACDHDALLNTLWYPGKTRVPIEINPPIEIRPNNEAELIFRILGMAVRNREALEDTTVLDKAFSFPLGEKASHRVELWREALITRLKTKVT